MGSVIRISFNIDRTGAEHASEIYLFNIITDLETTANENQSPSTHHLKKIIEGRRFMHNTQYAATGCGFWTSISCV